MLPNPAGSGLYQEEGAWWNGQGARASKRLPQSPLAAAWSHLHHQHEARQAAGAQEGEEDAEGVPQAQPRRAGGGPCRRRRGRRGPALLLQGSRGPACCGLARLRGLQQMHGRLSWVGACQILAPPQLAALCSCTRTPFAQPVEGCAAKRGGAQPSLLAAPSKEAGAPRQ